MAGIMILDMGHNTQLYLGLHIHEQEKIPHFKLYIRKCEVQHLTSYPDAPPVGSGAGHHLSPPCFVGFP